jgi:hypothetical protein
MTYAEKLRDPRWQKKRLEVLEAAGWACEWCSSSTKTLHVHHGYYRKGASPWDYGQEYLHALCYDCHERAEDERGELYRVIALIPPSQLCDLLPGVTLFAGQSVLQSLRPTSELPSDHKPEQPACPEEMEEFFRELRTLIQ